MNEWIVVVVIILVILNGFRPSGTEMLALY